MAAAVIVAAGLSATAEPPSSAVEGQSIPAGIAAPPPLPPGPAPDLALVFTAQVAGWIEPCG